MKKGKCTSGVYLIIGERGVRVGQSGCVETRVPKAQKEHEDFVGKPKHILRVPVIGLNERLALERDLIKALDPGAIYRSEIETGESLRLARILPIIL